MQVVVNGKEESLDNDNIILSTWLKDKNIDTNGFIVMINDEIIKQESWQSVVIKPSDIIEILNFVSGG